MPNPNGLKLQPLKSEKPEAGMLEPAALLDWNKFVKTNFHGAPKYAVFYLDYGIRFAKWENDTFVFEDGQAPSPDYLQIARIFNRDRELKIWKQNEAFYYRLRIDEEGEGAFAVDAEQFLWGTQILEKKNGWTRLFEERGTELCLPLEVAEIKVQAELESGKEYEYQGPLISVLTRNYIGELDNYTRQVTYVDCRFVDLKVRSEEEVRRLLGTTIGEKQNA